MFAGSRVAGVRPNPTLVLLGCCICNRDRHFRYRANIRQFASATLTDHNGSIH